MKTDNANTDPREIFFSIFFSFSFTKTHKHLRNRNKHKILKLLDIILQHWLCYFFGIKRCLTFTGNAVDLYECKYFKL